MAGFSWNDSWEKTETAIAFDVVLRRPGCPLVQAGMGGDPYPISKLFDAETWLVAPTENMKLYSIKIVELEKLAKAINIEQRAKR